MAPRRALSGVALRCCRGPSAGWTRTCSGAVPPPITRPRRIRAATSPISSAGKLIVVSGGVAISAIGSLTMPTTDSSSGTRRPRALRRLERADHRLLLRGDQRRDVGVLIEQLPAATATARRRSVRRPGEDRQPEPVAGALVGLQRPRREAVRLLLDDRVDAEEADASVAQTRRGAPSRGRCRARCRRRRSSGPVLSARCPIITNG